VPQLPRELHGAAVGRAKREGGEVRDSGRSQRSLALNSCGDAPADPAQNRPDRVGRGRRIEPLKAMRLGDGSAAPRNSGGLEFGIGERAKIGRDRIGGRRQRRAARGVTPGVKV